MELFDFDKLLGSVLGFKDYQEFNEFFTHFLLHFSLSFLLITVYWPLGFLSLVLGLGKEFINDGHWKDLFSNRDAKLDILARSLGSLLPFVSLLWGK